MKNKSKILIAVVLCIMIILMVVAKVKVNNTYKDFQVKTKDLSSNQYSYVDHTLKISPEKSFVKGKIYYAKLKVDSERNTLFPLNKLVLYRGKENQPSKFIDVPTINGKKTTKLKKGNNTVVIYTGTPTKQNTLYLVENPKVGKYIKYRVNFE
ncbi:MULTISPECIES: hypothetical protein [Lactobacillus]|uniref:DUF5067 domain-containing protein n=1 Tax=Lactobacillus xujianguonis TaxID=2495899 RepID=A0A437SX09_9LACO|nr:MULTISPECIES: hypothetical protein [Lactobacillus]RVU71465.1 hypothetical protein EJK17_01830 [Lactobacillus xujianguonis]RVU73688.1 hypothetical protein EJK20_06880 [Lactobacillus xujianguonis]